MVYAQAMGRNQSPIEPRKTIVHGQVRYEVRIPLELRKQEASSSGRKICKTQGEADGYCRKLKGLLLHYTDKARGLTDGQKIEAQDAFARLSAVPGANLRDAIDHYLAHLEQQNRSVTLEHLGETILAERRANGGKGSRDNTLAELSERWGRFARAFPGRMATSITPEEVHQWLMGLTKPTGEPVGLATRIGYRRVLNTVFEFAAARVRRWVAENPVKEIELPKPRGHRVYILPLPMVRQLLEVADPKLVPYFAICVFAGLRPDHAKEIVWGQIYLDRLMIDVPPGTDKTDPARIVPIQPCLKAWLEKTPAAERTGPLYYSKKLFRKATRAVLDPWKQDCLRHNFATYRFAVVQSFGQVAAEMGNSEAIIKARYWLPVSQEEAEAFWRIFPQ